MSQGAWTGASVFKSVSGVGQLITGNTSTPVIPASHNTLALVGGRPRRGSMVAKCVAEEAGRFRVRLIDKGVLRKEGELFWCEVALKDEL